MRDPLIENMVWTTTNSPTEVRDNGVIVCDGCDNGRDLYVCASPEWGPGKLVRILFFK